MRFLRASEPESGLRATNVTNAESDEAPKSAPYNKTMLGFNFNLEDQLVFYGQYHNHTVNKLVHFVFVPTILWTALVLLANVPLPLFGDASIPVALVYGLYYVTLEPVAGLSYWPVLGTMVWGAHAIQALPNPNAIAFGVHVISWIFQFIGHGVYEKRAPALLDSLLQALVLAPLFVWLEGLFVLGYRKDLQKRLHSKIGVAIQQYRKSLKSKQ